MAPVDDERVRQYREFAMTSLAVEALSNGFTSNSQEVWEAIGRWVPSPSSPEAMMEGSVLLGVMGPEEAMDPMGRTTTSCDVTTFEFSSTDLPDTFRVNVGGVGVHWEDPEAGWLYVEWGDGTLRPLWLAAVVEVRRANRRPSVYPQMGTPWTASLVAEMTPAHKIVMHHFFGDQETAAEMAQTGLARGKAIAQWKAHCTLDRFAPENASVPFAVALNAMLVGEDPGAGEGGDLVKTFLELANTMSVTTMRPLYRGTDGSEFEGDFVGLVERTLSDGETLTFSLPIASFADSPDVWPSNRFCYVIEPRAAIDAAIALEIGQFRNHADVMEFLVGGLMEIYRLDRADSPDGTHHLYMRQISHYVQ